MIRTMAMASRKGSFQRALSLVLLLTLLWQGPVKHCLAIQFSSVHTTMATPGAHCPLMLAQKDNAKPPSHHCDMQQQRQHRQCELRCACHTSAPTSTNDDGTVRYLLPHARTPFTIPRVMFWRPLFLGGLLNTTLSPPDPPPRFFSLASV